LGQDLFGENTLIIDSKDYLSVSKGEVVEGVFEFKLPMLPNGEYAVMASVADGDYHSNIQHHMLHDALVVNVSSPKMRYGLVGIEFQNVALNKI
jgi:lipopolysaccharide transport system ATP-binding protein